MVADLVCGSGFRIEELCDSLIAGNDFAVGLFSVLLGKEIAAI